MNTQGFIQKWIVFLGMVFSPGSVIPFIGAIVSLYYSFRVEGSTLSNALAVFASILTTISGFFIKDDWDRNQGNNLLEKKGRSALRNLEAIKSQILRIREWTKEFQKTKNQDLNLREIDRHLSTVEIHIDSGILDWIDVVPELEVLSTLRMRESELFFVKKQLSTLERKVSHSNVNAKFKEQLKNQQKAMKTLERGVMNLRRELDFKLSSSLRDVYRDQSEDNITSPTNEELEQQIKSLLEQIATLQSQLGDSAQEDKMYD